MSEPVSPPTPLFVLPDRRAFLLLFLLWACIYLPGLGGPELKGEEGRRILPAITMLETGKWLVPYVGGVPYLRKPPLVNWLIAGSFRLTGSRSEFAARLPSVLAMLALAATVLALGTGRGWMSTETALVAALIMLTAGAALDKGRQAEIEAVYLGVSGIAMVLWLAWWTQQRSPWLLWLAPSFFLGVGLLTKAPLHLLFFYAIAVAVLSYAREWRLLWHPAHFAGLVLAGGIFTAWAIPYFHSPEAAEAAKVWQAQSVGRMTGPMDWGAWAMNIPSALKDQLPWILFAPMLWRRGLEALGARPWAMYRGARVALVLCFFGLLLVPGVLPRYALPLLAVYGCLLAMALADERLPPARALRIWWQANGVLALAIAGLACLGPIILARMQNNDFEWKSEELANGWVRMTSMGLFLSLKTLVECGAALVLALALGVSRQRLARPALIAATSAGLAGSGMLVVAGVGVPILQRSERLRPVAQMIDSTVAAGETLYVYNPDYLPTLFYLHTPYRYAPNIEDIPTGTEWVLTREERRAKLLRDRPDYAVAQEFPKAKPVPLVLMHHVPAQP